MNWIDCSERMPEETIYHTDHYGLVFEGKKEPNRWSESEPVLAWDSMYGAHVDWTRNGKWASERHGGYQGQVCHGNVAWMPIPEMDIEKYKL